MAMSNAERQARWRERRRGGVEVEAPKEVRQSSAGVDLEAVRSDVEALWSIVDRGYEARSVMGSVRREFAERLGVLRERLRG